MPALHVEQAEDLETQIATLCAQLDAAEHRLLSLIRRYDESGAWCGDGVPSCAAWLSNRVGLAPGAAREKVRVARALGKLPAMDAALSKGTVSYSKVRAMTRVATAENECTLLTLAENSTAAQLERICRGVRAATEEPGSEEDDSDSRWVSLITRDDGTARLCAQLSTDEAALVMKAIEAARDEARTEQDESSELPQPNRADGLVRVADAFLSGDRPHRTGGDRTQLLLHLAASKLAEGELDASLEDGTRVSAEVLRRLSCDCGLVPIAVDDRGQPLSVGRKTRSIPPAIRRALIARDGCCQFPGCENRRWLDAHHVEHWIHGGQTAVENLVLLCSFHHRLLHEGGFKIAVAADGTRKWKRPDGTDLCPAPVAPVEDAVAKLAAAEAGLSIDEHTHRWYYDERRPDYAWCVDVVLQDQQPASPPRADGCCLGSK